MRGHPHLAQQQNQINVLSDAVNALCARPLSYAPERPTTRLIHATGRWWAGQTSAAPDATDPSASAAGGVSGYDSAQTTILWSGNLWPYMVPTKQMWNNARTMTWPAFEANTENNCYRNGVLIPRDTFVNGAELEFVLRGDWVVPNAAKVWMVEVILEPNIDPAAPSACDAATDKAIGFQFGSIDGNVNNGTFPFEIVVRGTAGGRSIASTLFTHQWEGRMVLGADKVGKLAPHIDVKRTTMRAISESTAFNWRTTDALMNFRYKVEINGTAFQTNGAASQNNTSILRANSYSVDFKKGRP